jgi:tricorn protease
VAVRVRQGDPVGGTFKVRLNEQATELALSPTSPEIALVARGDVFVVSLLTGATRRITHTGAEERGVSYAPDGRKLLYASERNGNWDLVEARLKRPQDKGFSGVAPFEEALLVGGPADDFQPLYSPRGDRVAYRGDRSSLRVFDIAAKTSIEVLPKDAVYSYEDDDWRFAWSPDGRWLVTRTGFENTSEIELVDASGREARRNLSLNGFQDRRPQVSADASAVLWLSDRESLRTISGDAVQTDVMAAFLSADSLADFRTSPPERAAASAATTAQPATSSTTAWPDVKGLARRTLRLTPYSSDVKFFSLTPDKRMLVVVTADEQGAWTGLAIDLPSGQPRTLFKRPPMPNAVFTTDAAVKTLYTLGPAGIDRIDLAGPAAGQVRTLPFDATVERDAQAEVAAIFEHAWRLTQAKFYDAKLHGVDWPGGGCGLSQVPAPHPPLGRLGRVAQRDGGRTQRLSSGLPFFRQERGRRDGRLGPVLRRIAPGRGPARGRSAGRRASRPAGQCAQGGRLGACHRRPGHHARSASAWPAEQRHRTACSGQRSACGRRRASG